MGTAIYTHRVDAVNMISVNTECEYRPMDTMGARLRYARKKAGFPSARQAALRFGWTISTYAAHENGQNDFDHDAAREYARAFKKAGVSAGWLLTGEGEDPSQAGVETDPATVPLVGYVEAGAALHRANVAPGELERVPAPENSTPETVAVEVRGDSLGSFFDRWLVYYDDVRRPVTSDLYNKLCVVGLFDDGGVFVKRLVRSKSGRHLFHLYGQFGDPILDVRVEWAARVKQMTPR